jgi:hypothetical protein
MKFDFGTDEEKAQSARHKLDVWKQAFRLDKKLQYKLDRPESAAVATEAPAAPAKPEKPAPAEKSKAKGKGKEKAKPAAASASSEKPAAPPNGKVSLLVRLYFSSHEKLSEQRWLDRIPTEEPFKDASPKVIHKNAPEFESADKHFEELE